MVLPHRIKGPKNLSAIIGVLAIVSLLLVNVTQTVLWRGFCASPALLYDRASPAVGADRASSID